MTPPNHTERVDPKTMNPSVKEHRLDGWMVPGHQEAANRLRTHDSGIFPAFDSLDLGMSHADAIDYMNGPLLSIPKASRGKVAGLLLAFAITAVEADRLRRDE